MCPNAVAHGMRCPAFLALLVLGAAAATGCLGVATREGITENTGLATYHDPTAYPALLIEIDFMPQVPPSHDAMETLRGALSEATRRQDVRVEAEAIDPRLLQGLDGEWTDAELIAIAAATLSSAPPGAFSNGSLAVLHVVYLEGGTDGDGTALGVANGRTAFLFRTPSTLPDTGLRSPVVERAVLVHEVGHILGLVNNGVPMVRPHEDPESPHHSRNTESVMYHAVDGGEALLATLAEGFAPPHQFDADDLADMRAFRERLASERAR